VPIALVGRGRARFVGTAVEVPVRMPHSNRRLLPALVFCIAASASIATSETEFESHADELVENTLELGSFVFDGADKATRIEAVFEVRNPEMLVDFQSSLVVDGIWDGPGDRATLEFLVDFDEGGFEEVAPFEEVDQGLTVRFEESGERLDHVTAPQIGQCTGVQTSPCFISIALEADFDGPGTITATLSMEFLGVHADPDSGLNLQLFSRLQ
jgi:hypothetical protein